MKFIRTNQIFCFLRNLTVLRRQKLRTYRSIQNIQKNFFQLFLSAGICIIVDKMSYKRFGNRGIYTIHGHMVSIIGCPSKSKLGKVTGSHKKCSLLVCHIHKNLSTLSGLTVFIGYIMNGIIVTDITEMDIYRLFNIDLRQRSTKALA